MSNENPGRTARTSGNAPMGSTVAIVVTAVALILGFLILRKVNDNGSTANDGGGKSQTTQPTGSTAPAGGTTSTAAATTTSAPVDIKATKVQVANASSTSGVAKQLTLALQGKGYSTAGATNSTVSPKLKKTKVLYNADDPAGKSVATEVAATLGVAKVEKGSVPLPTASAAWPAGVGVLVLLGDDIAGKTLDQIAGGGAATTTT
jgi:hypothetical protein